MRLMETIFITHNGVLLEPPILVPVTRSNASLCLFRHSKSTCAGSISQTKSGTNTSSDPNKSNCDTAGLKDYTNLDQNWDRLCRSPVLLNENGLPVCLPDSLHISFARYLTRLGSSLISSCSSNGLQADSSLLDQQRVFKCYQFGRIYNNPKVRSANQVECDLDQSNSFWFGSPIEMPQAAFNIVSNDFKLVLHFKNSIVIYLFISEF